MDRNIVYPGAIPLDTDQLQQNKNVMIGLGMALQAILGTATLVDGLTCSPTSPASMQVKVSAGTIYSLANVDSTSYGSLNADTTHQIVKQGISLDAVTLSCPAPSTTGYSQNYLIEVAYADTDAVPVVLPYYNASNPSVAYSGPANSGTAQNTIRKGTVTIQAKAGTAATTGTQTTPAADAGFTGLWVVTVANGASSITSGNITAASGAPFITTKLPNVLGSINSCPALVRGGKMYVSSASNSGTFSASEVVVETALAGLSYKLGSYSKVVNLATNGAGGMDTGSAPTSGFVALYAIYNPSTGASDILATNATSAAAPAVYAGANMPSGFTASALLSVWPTDGSGKLAVGSQLDRTISFPNTAAVTTSSTGSNVSQSISSIVPKNALFIGGNVSINGATSGTSNQNVSMTSDTNGIGYLNFENPFGPSNTMADAFAGFPLITAQTFYYSYSGSNPGGMTISLTSYTI